MLVYAGIDEAGYGPMLGPLCVGAAAFVVDGHDPADGAPNLWRRLNRAVCRGKRDRRGRIAIDDSKRLKGGKSAGGTKTGAETRTHPLRALERGVLAAVAAADAAAAVPTDDDDLFARLGTAIAEHPWYASRTELPVGQTTGELRIAAGRLRRALDAAGVACGLVACEAIDTAEFNAGVARHGTKADVNFAAAMGHVDRIWRRWPEAHPRVLVDRQGGRTRYREPLHLAFPTAEIRIVAEEEAVSRYRLDRDGSALTITFAPESEDRHLPVALASMTAKLVRELAMIRMNRFFTGRLPELKPTAGYVQDARRYLEDIAGVVDALAIDRATLVRRV